MGGGAARPAEVLRAGVSGMRIKAVGDCGLLIELGAGLDRAVHDRVVQLDDAIAAARLPGVVEVVVAYTSLLVIFDPGMTDFPALCRRIDALDAAPPSAWRKPARWRIPVAYGGEFGIDMAEAAARLGLETGQLIDTHAGAAYTIAMFGFLPGFAYLAGLPPRIALPRRATPRSRAPAGIIAIGGAQTAIGSIEGPTGWNIIGRTPVRTFDPVRYPATIFSLADEIRFIPVTEARFHELAARAGSGENVAERVA